MKVLITGVAGFVGSHLAQACAARGWSVVGIDCLTDYYDPAAKRRNLEELGDGTLVDLLEVDLAVANLEALVGESDIVFHLAAQPGVRASWADGFHAYVRSNILATQHLLECCRGSMVQRVVIASSSSVYGNAATLPTPETTSPLPISPYGATKLLTENLANAYWHSYAVPTVWLRYFTVYGPRQRPDMAFSRLITAGLTEGTFTIFGDGEQTRDFTFVEDAVEATISAGEMGAAGEAYNIGGGSRVSMNEVFKIVEGILERPLNVLRDEASAGDARHTGADTDKAAAALGYSPKWSLSAGLEAQAEWAKGLPRAPALQS